MDKLKSNLVIVFMVLSMLMLILCVVKLVDISNMYLVVVFSYSAFLLDLQTDSNKKVNGTFSLRLSKQKEPENLLFYKGQKVFCCITHEVKNSKVIVGEIVSWAFKKKSYWAFSDTPSDWYKVKYIDGTNIILPQDRIEDLKESIDRDLKMKEIWDKNPDSYSDYNSVVSFEGNLAAKQKYSECII